MRRVQSCKVAKFLSTVFLNAFSLMKSQEDEKRRREEGSEERDKDTYGTAPDSLDLVSDLDWGGDGEGCSAPA